MNLGGRTISAVQPHGCGKNLEGYTVYMDGGRELGIWISNEQACCEKWGYIASEDNPSEFSGATINGMSVYDGKYTCDAYEGEADAFFVTLHTSKGDLQFILYNVHNGYYGHRVVLSYSDTI